MAERVADESYEKLVEERVFVPLSLSSAGIGPPARVSRDEAWGHSRRDGTIQPHDPAEQDPFADLIRPAGDLHMNMLDLASFGQAHLRGLLGIDGFLPASTIQFLHEEVMDGYALGWNVRDRYNFHVGGLDRMHTAVLMMFKDEGRVFAVGSNMRASS